ncbi:MAG: response regulator [Deltaproteobacteria bacterium]|nr:response regulator [Deltaproteobacteria bacterium]
MIPKKVLAVDNHPVILKFITQLLSKKGHVVKTAGNGLEALKILEDYTPDVAFIDLVMPNIGGEKLCQIIRGMPKMRNTHLVILSALAADPMVSACAFGADACIPKGPFSEMGSRILNAVENTPSDGAHVPPESMAGLKDIDSSEVTKELLSVKRHFEIIMMSMSEGIVELNHHATVVYANPSALSLLDISEEKLLGSCFPKLFEADASCRIQTVLEATDGPDPNPSHRLSVRFKEKDITLNITPIQDEQNKTIVVLNDITQQKRMEAQLRQAQKMEAIGTLAGGIAHDFNNLLMAIQGNISLLLLKMSPEDPSYEKLQSIEKHVASGAKLTRQLLGYARKGKYEVKPVDLNHLVSETLETFGRTKKDIAIHKDLAHDLHAVEVDEGQIEQVLLNLFVNAAGAMPDGGHLNLITRNATHLDMHPDLYTPEPGDYVLIRVQDTGTGMDAETKKRIFEPFFTTKEMGRGTGLGLASAYGIIKSHGGYIEVDTQKHVGTTFNVFLPASRKAIVLEKNHDSRGDIARGNETILLVDDEYMILDVGKQLLEAMGYDVVTAQTGQEAVEIYSAQKDQIDLLILDVVMPEMNGADVFEKVKKVDPDAKVLLSSGYTVEGRATEILDRGCDGFIQKPFQMAQLSKSIRQVLRQ